MKAPIMSYFRCVCALQPTNDMVVVLIWWQPYSYTCLKHSIIGSHL